MNGRAADFAQQVHVTLIGRRGIAREGPQRREARHAQDDGGLALCQMGPIRQNVRGQDARLSSQILELCHERIERPPMMIATRVGFIGHYYLPHKGLDPGGDGGRAA